MIPEALFSAAKAALVATIDCGDVRLDVNQQATPQNAVGNIPLVCLSRA